MSPASGAQAGPYQILNSIGAGGMGEVYRARDNRLGRDVAIKILPPRFASDPDRLRRFEQEARATANLNHPNILAVFDTGSFDGAPYVVSELLEGETLRQRLSAGPLPQRKAIEIALQIASGLAAAHEKGILHRDLKPENLFLTRDGRLKILDFGLAKLSEPESPTHSAATAAASGTEAGTVLGTMGYMSPEQVRGQAVDARTDIFSFGAVLYEMLSGKRAFHGATSADTISAILREDPPDLAETNRSISPALDRIVRHCLEKNPEQRFHSARDLAFDLESLSGTSTNAASKPAYKPRRIPRFAIVAGLAVIAVIAAFLIGRYVVSGPASAAPEIHQLTFRRGNVHGAAFAPDGHTVVYAAEWEGSADEIFTTSEQGPDSRSLDLKDADLLAISSSGQMAIKVRPRLAGTFARPGTLATVPLTGGAPRELLDNVEDADFSPDGSQMAVILHPPGEQFLLQYPIGHTLLTEPYWLSHARVSPDGKSVAFASHPFGGDEGSVILADESGKVHELDIRFPHFARPGLELDHE